MNQAFEVKLSSTWSRLLRVTAILALATANAAQARVSVLEAIDSTSGHPTSFAQCPQFFANGGQPPVVAPQPKQRQLCYEAFAILHSGETKTPVYVAQVARMENEMTNLLGQYKLAEQSHSEDMLNLMIARGYIVKLVDNAHVLRYMQTHFQEVLEEFAKIVEMTTVET